ncbi:hypothetical protein [Streptomyces sp. AB3(2024)]|uniref:hypothetical protein n=1 Tax=Streptomyces sp. AB3(2024) TaxID=3317321 RepID=UPI0035A36F34
MATLFAQFVAGYTGSTVDRRGRKPEDGPLWSLPELQGLLDEWITAVWQIRPHDGLRDPQAPKRAFSPNEKYATLVESCGYVPVPLNGEDYIELLPERWQAINVYGIRIKHRTYDDVELGPLRRQHSGVSEKKGLWEIHYDPTTSPASGYATARAIGGSPCSGSTFAGSASRSESWLGTTPANRSQAAPRSRSRTPPLPCCGGPTRAPRRRRGLRPSVPAASAPGLGPPPPTDRSRTHPPSSPCRTQIRTLSWPRSSRWACSTRSPTPGGVRDSPRTGRPRHRPARGNYLAATQQTFHSNVLQHYQALLTAVRREPARHGLDGSFSSMTALLLGLDAGSSWNMLTGFQEWLVVRLGRGHDLTWPLLVRHLTPGGWTHPLTKQADAAAVITLHRLLRDYFTIRERSDGLALSSTQRLRPRLRETAGDSTRAPGRCLSTAARARAALGHGLWRGPRMTVSELVRAELGRYDWSSLRCGCGDYADHVPLLFETIITAETPRDMTGYTLGNHVEINTITFECTAPAVSVILAALAGELSSLALGELLQTLLFVAAGSGCGSEPGSGSANPDHECRARAQEGFWLLVQIGLTGSAEDAETVADICEYFGLGDEK